MHRVFLFGEPWPGGKQNKHIILWTQGNMTPLLKHRFANVLLREAPF
jgi:hypothetical protein